MQILEFGDPSGIPVVFHFGTPQRGEAGAEFSELARSLGVRLICPTRPWYDDTKCELTFEAVTKPTLTYIQAKSINVVHAVGGSGGGPFALHLAQADESRIATVSLFASMGHPESFARQVTSPPTVHLLKVFASRDHQAWLDACAQWGLPAALAHGAWGDFTVFFDQTASLINPYSLPVYVYQSLNDDNAPIQSVRDLLALASDVKWTIDDRFGHAAIAEKEGVDQIHEILSAVVSRGLY